MEPIESQFNASLFHSHDISFLKIKPPASTDDTPPSKVAWVVVLDNSYSMNDEATVKNDDGDNVRHGWSILDISKHMVNTIVHCMNDNDYLCVVRYSSVVELISDWKKMTRENVQDVMRTVNALAPDAATNMKDALIKGIECMKNAPCGEDYAKSMIFLTDGKPSQQFHPARGEQGYGSLVKTLRDGTDFELVSLGVCNQLQTRILSDISDYFIHIPDPGSIGPVCVNLISYLKSRLTIDGVSVNDAALVVHYNDDSNVVVPAGSMSFDEDRWFLVPQTSDTDIESIVLFGKPVVLKGQLKNETPEADYQFCKHQICDLLYKVAIELSVTNYSCHGMLQQIHDMFSQSDEPRMQKLLATLKDEIMLGVSNEFSTWGKHYAATMYYALKRCQKTSFRDKCLETYGNGNLTVRMCDFAENKFSTLPSPVPSLLQVAVSYSNTNTNQCLTQVQPVPAVLPDEFMRGGGCFAPTCKVTLRDGSLVRIADLKIGMEVKCQGGFDQVEFVVRTIVTSGFGAVFTEVNQDCYVTEWHPIQRNGAWIFPKMLGPSVPKMCNAVWNLVLKGRGNLLVGDVVCSTLAHGQRGDVIQHSLYGTSAIVDHFKHCGQWQADVVSISPITVEA